MQRILIAVAFAIGAVACAGQQKPKMTEDEASQEVQQLIALYTDAKAKFVVQKQKLEQAEDCYRATALRHAIDKMAHKEAMSTESNKTIPMVQMELQQAEKTCLAK